MNTWAHIFARNEGKFEPDKIASLEKPFPNLLKAIAQVRHTAVHRIRVSAKSVEQSMADAEQLALLLNDDTCAQTLSRLRHETSSIVEELSRNKDLLESKLADRLKDVASRRAELDRLEREAVEEMIKEDKDYQDTAGANLKEAIAIPGESILNGLSSENDIASDANADDDSFNEARLGHE